MAAVAGENVFMLGNISYSVIFSEEEANNFNVQCKADPMYAEQFLTNINNKESNATNSDSIKKDKICWTHNITLLLIEAYRIYYEHFKKPTSTKKEIWKLVSRKMKEFGVDVSGDICQKKWNNMMMTYRKVADNNNKTGRGKNFWPYFEKIDEIMGKTGSMVSVSELYKPPINFTLNEKNPDSPTIRSDTAMECDDDLTNISIIPENSNKNICKKKKKKIPDWAQELLDIQKKKSEQDAIFQKNMQDLFQAHLEENKRRTDALLQLTKSLINN